MTTFLDVIHEYKSFDDGEEEHLQAVLALLKETSAPFSRDQYNPGHITGSAFIVNTQFDKTCLIHHKKLNQWLQPGGHCDDDPRVEDTALRETNEETGLQNIELVNRIFDIDVHLIPPRKKNDVLEPEHKHHDVRYLAVADEMEVMRIQEEEINDIGWFTFEEAAQLNPWRSFSRMIDKVVSDRDFYYEWVKKVA